MREREGEGEISILYLNEREKESYLNSLSVRESERVGMTTTVEIVKRVEEGEQVGEWGRRRLWR